MQSIILPHDNVRDIVDIVLPYFSNSNSECLGYRKGYQIWRARLRGIVEMYL